MLIKFAKKSPLTILNSLYKKLVLFFIALGLGTGFSLEMAQAAQNGLPPKAQWSRNMGLSGIRRIYATGGELGELVNRQVSYQIAQRISSSSPRPGLPDAATSRVDGYVAQVDSLLPLDPKPLLPVAIRALARTATRLESDKVHSRNDRLDLGLLFAPTTNSFISLGIGMENTVADLKFVNGKTSGFAIGPRLDAGLVLNNSIALFMRLEDLQFSGDNIVSLNTPGGPLTISRNIKNHRSFYQFESLLRLDRSRLGWLPAGMQLGAMAGIHYLHTYHENQRNSLGQRVEQLYGGHERLGVLRTGAFLSSPLGNGGRWNTYGELLLDYEFDTNLHGVIKDPYSTLFRLAIAHVPGPGKRFSLEYQGSWNGNGTRKRNNFVLSVVLDF